MQRNSIVRLRPVLASRRIPGSTCADADTQAIYGCVDWYLYQNAPPVPAIERAAAAAGVTVTAAAAATQTLPPIACGW